MNQGVMTAAQLREACEQAVLSWLGDHPWDTSSMNIDFYREEVRAALGRLERRGLVRKRPTDKYRAKWEYALSEEKEGR